MTDDIHRRVFIKNIPYEINDDALSEWCSSFGPIAKCALIRDRFGNSRGFAFVTFATIDGHNNILAQAPHSCHGRLLIVKTACDHVNSNEYQSNCSSDPLSQTSSLSINDNLNSTSMDNSFTFDHMNHYRVVSLRDELEANLECMQIAHKHEIKILQEKLAREKKLLKEAEELYKEAEDDWRKVNDENIRLRTSLIKNVMQTFNIRKDLARRTKDQLKKCAQIEKQCLDINQIE
ncbi:unnamed protein product [Rotaria sp. Silwood1]|nr:unnamed protein product [Rotaria sp. Silwood1]CAF3336415.1 unnamed protein product [Rotaria sp. Silwood1]CAF3360321.1 unnamed protein product [Rotaria sp. Silwood1]CAF4593880.1 unnamed protein product [Rotaria sp. Silwood1]CAF4783406.1 unnamed protein product [Rotaria sp. Silwood1]